MGSVYGVEAFPLYWPDGWSRTRKSDRNAGRYQVSFAVARDATRDALIKMGGRDVLISSNIPLRRDGLPQANAMEPDDVGIAVYWTEGPRDKPVHRVLACDCWMTTRANLRAINLSIEGFLAIKRAGATQVLEQAFRGFTALPASAGVVRPWRVVLGLENRVVTEAMVREAFKRLSLDRHPDRGGSHEAMADLSRAFTDAKTELKQ